jgi:glycerol kinase
MQFQADLLGVPVVLGELAEVSALGAAYLAGVGAGLWSIEDLRRGRGRLGGGGARTYEPRMGEDERAGLLAGWADALRRARA